MCQAVKAFYIYELAILTTTLLLKEETDIREDVTCPGFTASEGQSADSNPGFYDSKVQALKLCAMLLPSTINGPKVTFMDNSRS